MIALTPNNDILIGGDDGDVAYSKDGGSTYTAAYHTGESGNVYVVADQDYADNNIFYAAVAGEVLQGEAVETDEWDGNGPAMTYDATGIGRVDHIIYVVASDGSSSELWRALALKDADNDALAYWSNLSKSHALDSGPQVLKISSGPKLWYVDTLNDNLDSTKDPIALVGPALKGPEDEIAIKVNPESGRAYNITFTWERYSSDKITKMTMKIATDPNFDGVVYNHTFTDIADDIVAFVVGPIGQEDQVAEFNPGTTYYWKTRVAQDGPMYSPWSETRSFKVEGAVAFAVAGPPVGGSGVELNPTFSWNPYEGASGYNLEVSTSPDFSTVTWVGRRSIDGTFYKAEEMLEYNTTYYWRVTPKEGGPSLSGVFTTMPEPVAPAPPIVVEPTPPAPPPTVIEVPGAPIPQPIPPIILWVIIAIGALLFIALIILIIRTRRV
jgi:hypothetical protein